MSAPLNIGILGFGRIGAEHAGWISASPAARVSAVYDITPARRQLAQSRGLQVAATVGELLSRCDAVLVATPSALHHAETISALTAGKHVMVEKPMALSAPQAREMAGVARRHARTLSVFHCRRWDADFLAVRQLLKSGKLGKVFNIESRLGQFSSCVGPAAPEWHPTWRNEAAYGGGGLLDWGSHFLDQLQLLLLPAKPVRVFAQLRANVWSTDCDDFARVLIDFTDGTAALCEINTTTTLPLPRWHIDGTLGSATAPHSPTFDTSQWARLQLSTPNGQSVSFSSNSPDRLSETDIWTQFAAACARKSQPAVTVESVIPTMQLLDAARQSAEQGRAIAITSE